MTTRYTSTLATFIYLFIYSYLRPKGTRRIANPYPYKGT